MAWGGRGGAGWGLQTQVFGVSLRVLLRLEETKAGCPHLAPPPKGGIPKLGAELQLCS